MSSMLDDSASEISHSESGHGTLPLIHRMSFGGSLAPDTSLPSVPERALELCSWLQWDQLYARFRIVVEIKPMQGRAYARVSAQVYNQRSEYEALADAVLQIRAEVQQLTQQGAH